MSEKKRSSDSTPKEGGQPPENERIGFKSGSTGTLSGKTSLSGAGISSGPIGPGRRDGGRRMERRRSPGLSTCPANLRSGCRAAQPGQDSKWGAASPLDELPIHLTFREASTSPAGEIRQAWLSDESARWHWRLTVGSTNGRLVAELTATSPGQSPRCESGTWQLQQAVAVLRRE